MIEGIGKSTACARCEGKLARISWQEITKRFSHIDARFVRCEIGLPNNDGYFSVDLYPWWEHPLYLEARTEGENWGFRDYAEGYSEVTVYPKNVYQFQLSRQAEVIDWDFTREHPVLWQYEENGAIICNSPLSLKKWLEISVKVKGQLTGYNRDINVAEYALWQVHRWGHTGSFSLGLFPYSLFGLVCQALDAENVRYFIPSQPKPVKLPVVFLIDNDDYIIADDFEIDVPEFVHKPEWFQPH